jgi:LysR family glycine cleavage system transcriptional activator
MKHKLPSLDSLKAFESAARHLSFSLAAEELCITKGAISYQIRKLEESIDCALFKRSIRQVYLTDAGQKLLHTTQRLFRDLGHTIDQLGPNDGDHDVSIGATTYVALRWLSPRVARFSELNPDVSIVLQHPVNTDDFRLQDVDIAIQWNACEGHSDRSRLLEMPMSLYPVCSPKLLQRLGIEDPAIRLTNNQISLPPFDSLPLLCEDRRLDLWQAWYGEQPHPLQNPRRVIADANVRTQAAIDGQGWTMADALMSSELAAGVLVAPFEHQLEGYGYVLMASPGRYLNRKARELRDWLVREACPPL